MAKSRSRPISFDFEPGATLVDKYVVEEKLGGGWEGEVYRIREKMTGVERAAKFFYPQRNEKDQAVKFYAKKLHTLRDCPCAPRSAPWETTSGPVTIFTTEPKPSVM